MRVRVFTDDFLANLCLQTGILNIQYCQYSRPSTLTAAAAVSGDVAPQLRYEPAAFAVQRLSSNLSRAGVSRIRLVAAGWDARLSTRHSGTDRALTPARPLNQDPQSGITIHHNLCLQTGILKY